jgi:uncharacterized protein YlxP (DUF503 family)
VRGKSVFVVVCRLEIHIEGASSLKNKRGVVQSIIRRVRNQFRVSIAEVDALEVHNLAVLGMAAVSNDGGHARGLLEEVVRFLERTRLDADVGLVEFDVLSAL